MSVQRVILKRYPATGKGVAEREDRFGRLFVRFDPVDGYRRPARWCEPDELMPERVEARVL